MTEYDPGYDKETLLKAYKDYFIKDLPLVANEIPQKIGYLNKNNCCVLWSGWAEKEGEFFFFIIESSNLKEIEPEKLAYILSDSWGNIRVKYDNEWSLTSSYNNKYSITLIGNTLEELFEHYNSIVREVAGKVLDSYPNH